MYAFVGIQGRHCTANVELTLAFLLCDAGVVQLKSEVSLPNMRALYVGNLIKKGSNARYTGKKGIGFTSFKYECWTTTDLDSVGI